MKKIPMYLHYAEAESLCVFLEEQTFSKAETLLDKLMLIHTTELVKSLKDKTFFKYVKSKRYAFSMAQALTMNEHLKRAMASNALDSFDRAVFSQIILSIDPKTA